MICTCVCACVSPFAPEKEGLDEATSTDSWKATRKTSFSGKKKEEDEEEEGLPSLVQTTLHGDCRPVLEYGLVSYILSEYLCLKSSLYRNQVVK